jgi:3-phosphoshikimate 1-carboxyvinyltransferase
VFLEAKQSVLHGVVAIPGSKSHTIRALILAALADGESRIRKPLDSLDTVAAVKACRAFGAEIDQSDPACWVVRGVAGRPQTPDDVIDVMNSGTTLYVVMATAALCDDGMTVLTGDEQIRRRPAEGLSRVLRSLGAEVTSTRGNGMCPLVVRGPLKGGHATVGSATSQWVTAILLNGPLALGNCEIDVPEVVEAPYIRMTLDWIESLGICIDYTPDFSHFSIPGGQKYPAFDRTIAADFSSATFFLVAGALLGEGVTLTGLDMEDSQGDKAVVDYLRAMGAPIDVDVAKGSIHVHGGRLKGAVLDLNATPDALPAMAVAAALAEGTTRFVNVPQARLKETDRIAVMTAELTKMGVCVRELPDGLEIEGRPGGLQSCVELRGHGDHRVVMALAIAGMACGDAPSRIDTAEAVAVTFPEYGDLMRSLGAKLKECRE